MRVLVLNSGSSSLKYQLIDLPSGGRAAAGLAERIGERGSRLVHNGAEIPADLPDLHHALTAVLSAFGERGPGLERVVAVGHRVVHGGTRFSAPVVVDDEVESTIAELESLAPLHNPANLDGIKLARRALPDVPHVAVFDTAFHQTLPAYAYTYAVPREWEVRKFGFHGTSHAYVSRRAAELLGRPYEDVNTIVLHLGNGASATAVRGGESVDTSMGLTPLAGLVMGTRSGDVDPALPAYLSRTRGMDVSTVDEDLNRASGLQALAGASDLREVWKLVDSGDSDARLAMDVYGYRLRTYIGAYYAALGHVDAIAFTAGVGEHDPRVRALALTGLARLGIELDPLRNDGASAAVSAHGAAVISPEGAEVTVLVVPTDEELEIARQTLAMLEEG